MAAESPVTLRRESVFSLPSSSCGGQVALEKPKEAHKNNNNGPALNYPNAIEDPYVVLLGLTANEVDARNSIVVVSKDNM